MRTLLAGAARAVVVMVLAVGSLRATVWLLYGTDPSSDADIGLGLLPIGAAALVSVVWAYADARRHPHSEVRRWWLTAAGVCAAAAAARSMPSIGDAALLGVLAFLVVALPAYAGSVCGPRGRGRPGEVRY